MRKQDEQLAKALLVFAIILCGLWIYSGICLLL